MTRQQRITTLLTEAFNPTSLTVINESSSHSVPKGSETHFKVVVCSDFFSTMSRVKRHRHIQQVLAKEFTEGLHALSIHAYSVNEWEQQQNVPQSPACRGGSKTDKN